MDNLLAPSFIHSHSFAHSPHTHVVAMGSTHVYQYRSVSSVHGSRINLCMPIKCDTRIPNYNSKVHLDRQIRCIADVYEIRKKHRLALATNYYVSKFLRPSPSMDSSISGYTPALAYLFIIQYLNGNSARPKILELSHLMSDVLVLIPVFFSKNT